MKKGNADRAATRSARVTKTAQAEAVFTLSSAPAQPSASDQPTGINTLREPITVARLWRNRRRDEMIVIRLKEFKGSPLVDVRTYFTDHLGCMQPTKKGIVLGAIRLPDLAAALNKAVRKANELGLITAVSS